MVPSRQLKDSWSAILAITDVLVISHKSHFVSWLISDPPYFLCRVQPCSLIHRELNSVPVFPSVFPTGTRHKLTQNKQTSSGGNTKTSPMALATHPAGPLCISLHDCAWHWRTTGANLLPITAPSVKGPLFLSLSQWKFPARTNSGLSSPANAEFFAFCVFLHVLALVGEAAPLSGVWVSLQICVIYNAPDCWRIYLSSQVQQVVLQTFTWPLHHCSHIHVNAW